MSISVKNLTKSFGTQKAVSDLSFDIKSNGVVGFLGPNGAGKSTTMKMITGYMQPDMGSIAVNEVDVNSNPNEAKMQIGYLPEGNPLYYDMYVREYLGFVASAHAIENRSKRVEEVIKMTGLTPESKKKTGQLSKGYKQRVGLAAALIHDPKVLILDEPTSGLDPNQIIEIRQLIKDLGHEKTVLFSSHILQEVESICSRIIIINKGSLVADDQIENLKTSALSTGAVVVVKFSTDPELQLLHEITGVRNVIKEDGHFLIQTNNPDAVKKQLLNLSVEKNIDIISLLTKDQSLEEVFRNVTSASEESK